MRTPSMSEKQESFIKSLVDQLGYKDSPFKEYFINRIHLDEGLLEENKKRKYPNHWVKSHAISTIQDLTQFAFCPASYSVKESFKIEFNKNEEEDDEDIEGALEPKSYLLELISFLRKMNNIDRSEYLGNNKIIKYLLDSLLIYNGSDGNKPLYDIPYNISGKPHLIFENSSGERILVVEKNTFNDKLPEAIWHNHQVQVWAYIHLFNRLDISKAYVIYWHKRTAPYAPGRRNFRVYEVDSAFTRDKLTSILDSFNSLRSETAIPFDVNSINPEKCFRCTCRTICNHKSGLIKDLLFPYATDEYYKKYPLHYTMAERLDMYTTTIEDSSVTNQKASGSAKEYEDDLLDTAHEYYEELQKYYAELQKHDHHILEQLLNHSFIFEKESVGEVTQVESSDIEMSESGDMFIKFEDRFIYVKELKNQYKTYLLSFELADGNRGSVLIGE